MVRYGIGKVGGQGGFYGSSWYHNTAGDGGQGGQGGLITYSASCKIYAFNGKMNIEEQSTPFYEYNCTINEDNKTSETKASEKELNAIIREDGKEIIPSKIFAQSGIIRETYTTNTSEYELKKVQTGEVYQVNTNGSDVLCVIATYAKSITTLQYSNPLTPDFPNQGIGSRSWISRIRKWNF